MKAEVIDMWCDRRLGFITRYATGKICCSVALFGSGAVCFYKRPILNAKGFPIEIDLPRGTKVDLGPKIWKVDLDHSIEDLDVYHAQYGISISEDHSCFFIGSWTKGLYCCDINTGKMLWRYHLKHCNEVYTYKDYLVVGFREIGLRKLSYDGNEIERYAITTEQIFSKLEDPYVFVGPRRGKYFVIDTRTMNEVHSIPESAITNYGDTLIILDVSGTPDEIHIVGFENHEKFEKRISLS